MIKFPDAVPEKFTRLAGLLAGNGWTLIQSSSGKGVFRKPKRTPGEYYKKVYVSYLEDDNDNCITITWGDAGKVTDVYPDTEELD